MPDTDPISYTISMECRAKVISSDGRKALVRAARANCAECGHCGLFARDRERVMEFTVADRLGEEKGDEVILFVPSRRLYLVYLIIFGLPLLAMAASYLAVAVVLRVAGVGGSQALGVGAAVLAGFVALWGGVKLAERKGLSPLMLEKLESGNAGVVEVGSSCCAQDGSDPEASAD